MSTMSSQVTGKSADCSTACFVNNKKQPKQPTNDVEGVFCHNVFMICKGMNSVLIIYQYDDQIWPVEQVIS